MPRPIELRNKKVLILGIGGIGSLIAEKSNAAGFGLQNAALVVGGRADPTRNMTTTEQYNGSTWSEVADLNQGRQSAAMIGSTNTAALLFGGTNPDSGPLASINVLNESWNGSAWTEVSDLNSGRHQLSGAG